ncbi:MAG: D-alanyl-D-alanine carboxypeptidase DacC [Chlamydiae bacterium]|nr:D-alanyl-D-alanine carboxypeptidase DacC [Chlamydiota bacterium]
MRRFLILCLVLIAPLSAAQITSKEFYTKLERGIDQIISPVDKNVHIGIEILSLKSGLRLYEKNAHKLFVPASSVKLFTAGAALSLLGPDFTFETNLLTDGSIDGSTLKGNLYLQGSGDPSFSLKDLEQMVLELRLRQVEKIEGDLIVDNFAFDDVRWGPGWMWDDTQSSCYAPMNALTINENCLRIWIKPAEKVAQPPKVFAFPRTRFVRIENHALTDKKKSTLTLESNLKEGRNTVEIIGEIPQKSALQSHLIPLQGSHFYAVTLLQSILKKSGITWTGKIQVREVPDSATSLATNRSSSLAMLLHKAMEESSNLYTDLFFKKIGQVASSSQGTWKNGKEALHRHLEVDAGLDTSDMVILDGSGLTRYNLASPHQFVTYLRWIYEKFPYSAEYLSALPIGARTGTLKNRYSKDLPLLRAKTGRMTGITSLCGFIRTQDQEPLAFAILISGFTEKTSKYKTEVEDAICTFLGNLSRE